MDSAKLDLQNSNSAVDNSLDRMCYTAHYRNSNTAVTTRLGNADEKLLSAADQPFILGVNSSSIS